MKKVLIALIVLTLILSVFVSCKNEDEQVDTQGSEQQTKVVTTEEGSEEDTAESATQSGGDGDASETVPTEKENDDYTFNY